MSSRDIARLFFEKMADKTDMFFVEERTCFSIRKPLFCLSINFLNLMLEIRLRFS